jgi:DNA-binding NarL/FixJ family response regulator
MALVVLARAAVDRPPSWIPPESTSLASSAEDPTLSPHHPLWQAALAADQRSTSGCPLPHLWNDVLRGHLSAWWESVGADRILLVARLTPWGRGLCPEGALILSRILCGDQQKVVASELELAASTVSGRYVRALTKLEIVSPRKVPLALVLAAQSAAGIDPIASARSSVFGHHQSTCLVVSVPRPATTRMTALTMAEQDIAQWIIEGYSRSAIARRRTTSVHTVARQFHSIFAAMKVTGRFALIRRAVELHGFR